jgi:hypothetical protein
MYLVSHFFYMFFKGVWELGLKVGDLSVDKVIRDLEKLSAEVKLSVSEELEAINANVEAGLKELEVFFSEYRQN